MTDLAARAQTLLDLHRAPELLVLANAWDVVSARAVAAVEGTRAIATPSHGIAATFGYEDGEQIPLDLHLDMVARIASAVSLPVTMDFEAGYGDPGETTRRAIAAGAVGGNLEDGLKPLEESVAAVEASLRAARDAGVPGFVLNARTDAFTKAPQGQDPADTLAEAVRRCKAYLEVGAPVVFVPRAARREHVEALVSELGRGVVTLISIPGASLPARELEALGVARLSTGPFTQRVALTALQDATAELLAGGVLPPGTRALN
ncbi:isocitrate lyase/phosphoenolpyruvate mutase family protein [Streptomyces sp. NP160]|uniref:isocitrate lyase/PEP mutase family protein n=1 Tax=Streptomyces sp. NP160 TaxID=2586637 RepID=UPI0011182816|nr:isocitrate lyase/phosphoenolpyruvate mutase family protein [Streptomyces sp. NP160]TNM69113.1 isocitrate lyase/phosphoenolpyruvate mutase family protein [Streptomyces sp. NP160]